MKGQKERAIEEYYVYGWKVLVLIDMHTRLPLSMKVVTIEAYEGRWLVPLLEQAQHNLGTHGHDPTIVIDRGYLDGEDLWQVQKLGLIFVIVGKANMTVTRGLPKRWPNGSEPTSGSASSGMDMAKPPHRSACAPNWWALRA